MRQRHEAGPARWSTTLAAALAATMGVASSSTVHARTGACQPVRVAESASGLAGPWRDGLDALVRATAQEGLPWSCPGGTVELTPDASHPAGRPGASRDEGGAVLTVTDAAGHVSSRRVAGPQEVVATGEALLASPLAESTPLGPPPVAPGVDSPSPSSPPGGRSDPRLQIQVLIGPRASGPGAMAWGSAYSRLQIPFGPWSIAFWGRYDLHLAGPGDAPPYFGTSAFSVGLGGGRRIISAPFELRATFDPSVAVVLMESGFENKPHPEGSKPALRLGTSLSALFPIAGVFRGVVSIDGELAPAGFNGIGNIDTSAKPQLPPVPWYTAGILLGFEASIR